jgi:hypothetical protein
MHDSPELAPFIGSISQNDIVEFQLSPRDAFFLLETAALFNAHFTRQNLYRVYQ